jgi:uncharacterized protein (TIGR02265 family)
MPADRQDLQLRLAAATPEDNVRGLAFNACFDLLREHGGEPLAEACDPAGRHGKRTDFFSYPVADYLETAFRAADRLEAALGSPEAVFREIGRRVGGTVLDSLLGRTLRALAGERGPRQLMASAPAGYKATVSYGERTVSFPTERSCRLVMARDFLVPPFHCGVLEGALAAFGARRPRATGEQTGFLAAAYDVSWE